MCVTLVIYQEVMWEVIQLFTSRTTSSRPSLRGDSIRRRGLLLLAEYREREMKSHVKTSASERGVNLFRPGSIPVTKMTVLILTQGSHVANVWFNYYCENLFTINQQTHQFSKFILSKNSTCFGQFLCPSSGVFHCTFSTGICHAGSMTYTSAECTMENSWWWAEELPETCRVFDKIILEN